MMSKERVIRGLSTPTRLLGVVSYLALMPREALGIRYNLLERKQFL